MHKYVDINKNEKVDVGTVVRLKAGGMDMTVEGGPEGEVACVWFDASNQLQRARFRSGALMRRA